MTDTAPDVQDWATDYELLDQSYAASPYAIWDDLRERCPVAHSDRNGGSWMPTTNEDVREIAKNTEIFTSQNVAVIPVPIAKDADGNDLPPLRIPPIDTDPPHHKKARRMILPTFSPRAVAERDTRVTRILPDAPLPSLPVWLTAHDSLRHTPRVARVWDALAEGLSPFLS